MTSVILRHWRELGYDVGPVVHDTQRNRGYRLARADHCRTDAAGPAKPRHYDLAYLYSRLYTRAAAPAAAHDLLDRCLARDLTALI